MDDTSPNPRFPHNVESFAQLFLDSALQVQKKTVNGSEDILITFINNAELHIPAHSLYFQNGQQANGNLQLEMIEIKDKIDLLMSTMPLQKWNGNILEAAGMFYLTASKDGEPLNLDEQFTLTFPKQGALIDPDGSLSIYYHGNENYPWSIADTNNNSIQLIDTGSDEVYQMKSNHLGWLSACQDLNFTNTGSITVRHNRGGASMLEERAYLLFHDFMGMVELPKLGDKFVLNELPEGYLATLVVMSYDKYQFYMASQEIVLGEEEDYDLDMTTYTVSGFLDALDAM
ncbi:MAG TPA: hypothetical protein ENJ45_00055 [Phaeodactylibacter sp.]|nr:hypothetical protein [Phaeodactylibacter sp.]